MTVRPSESQSKSEAVGIPQSKIPKFERIAIVSASTQIQTIQEFQMIAVVVAIAAVARMVLPLQIQIRITMWMRRRMIRPLQFHGFPQYRI
jgi:hypothetical protein